MGHGDGCGDVLLEPHHHSRAGRVALAFVHLAVGFRRLASQSVGAGVLTQSGSKLVARSAEAEEHLIRLALVLESRRVIGLKEVDIEVPWRLSR